jgi:hypothetical protein
MVTKKNVADFNSVALDLVEEGDIQRENLRIYHSM